MLPIKKILCPTDFSEPSLEAVKTAREWAAYFSAELLLLHVVTPAPVIPVGPDFVMPDLMVPEQEMENAARKSLEDLKEKFGLQTLKVRSQINIGNAADEIVRTAEEERVDMIIIATHGRTGINRLLFGSVAEKTVRLADCPVLTVSGQSSDNVGMEKIKKE
ncbi:MAG: universal stress protein [Thermodesulfobacteriota bacterium]